ncbi:hypothetical protein H6P81_021073 [Aristolochia fimbriata]|uniref:FAR1 domain-containing protein n=1 Tax=Aristolochia fimbriata TaxID=158543 RepID=A0AAV7DX56_ARIFI|nr:hypothetical protein H6P81_021073 [Aristolochia fimbriata]
MDSGTLEFQSPVAIERSDCCCSMDLECAASAPMEDVSSPVNDTVAVLDAFYVTGDVPEDNSLSEPRTGMKFESEKALFSFYQEYAIRLGFSITISSRRRSRTNSTIIAGVYACSRYGFKKPSERKYKPRPTFKTGCKAMIKAKRMETGTWTILEVIKDHNHELDPTNVRLHSFTYEDEGSPGVRNLAAMENIEPSVRGDGIEGSSGEIVATEVAESEPFIGMEFECEDAGFSFYSEYARFMGFNIITKSRRRSKIDKTLIAGLYTCSKNGYKMPNENVKFPRPNIRIGCKAMLKVKELDSGRWIVIDFIKEHNHELSPNSESGQIFQSHKGIQTGGRNALRNRCTSNIRSNKLYSILSRQSVGRRRKALKRDEWHNNIALRKVVCENATVERRFSASRISE